MTIQGPVIRFQSSGVPANDGINDGRWVGAAKRMIPKSIIPKLTELHLFGTDWSPVFPYADEVADYSIGDHALNGRHLSKFGSATPGADAIVLGGSDYYLSPITGADLMALSADGSFSVWVVVDFTDVQAMAVGCWNSSINDGWGLGRQITTSTRYQSLTSYADGGVTDQNTPVLATDAYTGTGPELLMVSYDIPNLTINLHRQKPGAALQTVAPVTMNSATFAPAQRICWGRSFPVNNFVAPVTLYAGGLIAQHCTTTMVEDIQGMLQAAMATKGITI